MPTDIQAAAYNAVFTAIQSGIAAYNAAITANTLTGCQPVAPMDLLDDRTDGRQRAKIASKAPADFPQVKLSITGGSEQKGTITFGLMNGANCDAIVPMVVTLMLVITHDTVTNASQTPLESYIDAGLHAVYPKLGISYCAGFTASFIRRDELVGGTSRTVRRTTINVNLRPHLATLR